MFHDSAIKDAERQTTGRHPGGVPVLIMAGDQAGKDSAGGALPGPVSGHGSSDIHMLEIDRHSIDRDWAEQVVGKLPVERVRAIGIYHGAVRELDARRPPADGTAPPA